MPAYWNVCHSVEIEKEFEYPQLVVWNTITNKEEWNLWSEQGQIEIIKDGDEERFGEGCQIRYITSQGITTEKIISFEAPERVVSSYLGGGYWDTLSDHTSEIIIDKKGNDACILSWRCRFNTRVVGIGWALEKVIRKEYETVLNLMENFIKVQSEKPDFDPQSNFNFLNSQASASSSENGDPESWVVIK